MESLATVTKGGTYMLGIERTPTGNVGRVELHLALVPGEDTGALRDMLGGLQDLLTVESGGGDGDLRGRLNALIGELFDQDEAHEVPTEEPAEVVSGKATFDVILEDAGDKKINVIKIVREVTTLGLKEAKDLIDTAETSAGAVVVRGVSEADARQVARKFKAAGANVLIV